MVTTYDDNKWWQHMVTTHGDNTWWQHKIMTANNDNTQWQYMMTTHNTHVWKVFKRQIYCLFQMEDPLTLYNVCDCEVLFLMRHW